MKKYNFCSGPSVLPRSTVENTAEQILDFDHTSFSLMEINHRGKEFSVILDDAIDAVKDLLHVPSGYSVLFLGGGASLHFCMIPYNLLQKTAVFLNTGRWAQKAMKEASIFGHVLEVASSEQAGYNFIPKDYVIPNNADYFHITSNNTVYGTQIHRDIDSPIPLVADMSSDIFSRPIDVSKYGIIYAGAQKNLAPAGLSLAIVRNDILGYVSRKIPSILDYRVHIENGSHFNTPPVLQIYAALQTLKWLKSIGGLNEIHQRNVAKATLLYNELDRNKLFRGTAQMADRSLMNVCFVMNSGYEGRDDDFLAFAESRGLYNLRGHRSVGGFRAAIYNAMPIEGVEELVSTLGEYESLILK